MDELEHLRAFILELTHDRGVPASQLEILLQLLAVPKIRDRFPTLTNQQVEETARGFVRSEETRRAFRRRKRER